MAKFEQGEAVSESDIDSDDCHEMKDLFKRQAKRDFRERARGRQESEEAGPEGKKPRLAVELQPDQ